MTALAVGIDNYIDNDDLSDLDLNIVNFSKEDKVETISKSILAKIMLTKPKWIFLFLSEKCAEPEIIGKFVGLINKLGKSDSLIIITDYFKNNYFKILRKNNLIKNSYANISKDQLFNFLNSDNIEILNPQITIENKNSNTSVLLLGPLAWNPDFPQLGLAYLYTSLSQEGYFVEILDCNVDFFTNSDLSDEELNSLRYMPKWIDRDLFKRETFQFVEKYIDQICTKILEENFKVLGISIHHSSEVFTEHLLTEIKKREIPVKIMVVGPSVKGPIVDIFIKKNLIDLAVIGEGEYAVKEAVKYFQGQDANLSGCITNNHLEPLKHENRPLGDIDDIPIPKFTPFRINDYESYIMPTSFGRGCVAKCSFCFETVYWKKFRVKSPELVLTEIVEMVEKYRIKFFSINDSLMNGNHKFLEDFCDRLIQTKLGVTYFGYCRVDKRLTQELLNKMKESGCRDIAYGVESGSPKILKLMKKGVIKENIYPTLKRTHQAGINVATCFIVGHPHEGLRDYIQTCLLIFKCRKYINELNLSVFNPEYETQMMNEPEKYNLVFKGEKWVSTEFWNHPRILDVKYFIINYCWTKYRGIKASPTKWLYKRPSAK